MKSGGNIVLSVVLLSTSGSAAVYADSFTGLGILAGDNSSVARDVSANGTTVVGDSAYVSTVYIGGTPYISRISSAIRWSSDTGIIGLGTSSSGMVTHYSNGISADASTIVGSGYNSNSNREAFSWTAANGFVGLGDLPGGTFSSQARDVSADGSVIVGDSRSDNGQEAFRWTAETGMVGLGDFDGTFFTSIAYGTSADGSVVVGRGFSGQNYEAFRWAADTGMVGLGTLNGSGSSFAQGVSADGTAIVGYSNSDTNSQRAFRWTAETGMTDLGYIFGESASSPSQAWATSADGSIVVGQSWYGSGYGAFIWDEKNGMQSLQAYLENSGIDLSGWTLTNALNISDEGNTIVGYGLNPNGETEGWVVNISSVPVPSAVWLFGSGLIGLAGFARRRK